MVAIVVIGRRSSRPMPETGRIAAANKFVVPAPKRNFGAARARTESAFARFHRMRTICDYTLKFILLFFIFARFLSAPAPESQAAAKDPVHEPSSDSQT